jgi:dTDP-4-amino-4,6-dideoxygalactose transaminase
MKKKETIPFLDLVGLHAPLREKMLAVVDKALDTAGFIGGPNVMGFEAEFAAACQTSDCVGVASGTDALVLALLAMDVGIGDTVLTVPNTFIATTEAISQTGAHIAFVDVDEETSLMDMAALERLLRTLPVEKLPKVVIPVHLYGQCADMDPLLDLARKFGFSVLEDACQAHGASYKGRRAGSLGRAAAFSFYPGKNLGACGEGGAVTTNDPELAARVRVLRDHGQQQKYIHVTEGRNGRLDAIQAGFLRAKLPYLEEWNARRRALSSRYDEAFGDLGWIRPAAVPVHNLPARHLYVVHTAHRDLLAAHLAAENIQTGLHYPRPLHLQECYARLGHKEGAFPVAEELAATLLSLPLFPGMKDEQIERVIDAVVSFGESARDSRPAFQSGRS